MHEFCMHHALLPMIVLDAASLHGSIHQVRARLKPAQLVDGFVAWKTKNSYA
jgi:hypothetical protein